MSFVLLFATVVASAPLVQDTARGPRTAADSVAAQALLAVRVSADRSSRTQYRVTHTRSSTRTLTPLREVPQAITVLGPQILRDLGVTSIRNIAVSSRSYVGLSGFGIELLGNEPPGA